MNRSIRHINGPAIAIDRQRTITPIFEVKLDCVGGKHGWWINMTAEPVRVLVKEFGQDGGEKTEELPVGGVSPR